MSFGLPSHAKPSVSSSTLHTIPRAMCSRRASLTLLAVFASNLTASPFLTKCECLDRLSTRALYCTLYCSLPCTLSLLRTHHGLALTVLPRSYRCTGMRRRCLMGRRTVDLEMLTECGIGPSTWGLRARCMLLLRLCTQYTMMLCHEGGTVYYACLTCVYDCCRSLIRQDGELVG
jgi:hypothetical protein